MYPLAVNVSVVLAHHLVMLEWMAMASMQREVYTMLPEWEYFEVGTYAPPLLLVIALSAAEFESVLAPAASLDLTSVNIASSTHKSTGHIAHAAGPFRRA